MLIAEILNGKVCHTCDDKADIEPSEDEIKGIQLDKMIRKRPKVQDMVFTVMPGNTSSYPFQ